jgi:prepilin-type N-terminal cleavage/methylation domain-containing protein
MFTFKRGFTLIELLVVITIIGILSGIVLESLNGARMKGRDAKRVADIKQLQLAITLYYDANSSYPSAADVASGVLVNNGFIAAMPTDPTNSGSHVYTYVGLASAYNATFNPNPATCTASPCGGYLLADQLEDSSNAALTDSADIDTTVGGINCADASGNNMYCVAP